MYGLTPLLLNLLQNRSGYLRKRSGVRSGVRSSVKQSDVTDLSVTSGVKPLKPLMPLMPLPFYNAKQDISAYQSGDNSVTSTICN